MDTASRIDCGASTPAGGAAGGAVAIRWALVPFSEITVGWPERPSGEVPWWHCEQCATTPPRDKKHRGPFAHVE
jgi:hypothetical protein